jgi:hypothetical protein
MKFALKFVKHEGTEYEYVEMKACDSYSVELGNDDDGHSWKQVYLDPVECNEGDGLGMRVNVTFEDLGILCGDMDEWDRCYVINGSTGKTVDVLTD